MKIGQLLVALLSFSAASVYADTAQTTIFKIIPNAATTAILVGTVTATDTPYGLLLTPNLKNLPPGVHGFHIHQNPSCGDSGMAAGGHLDPQATGKHLGPYGEGHLGDMAVLIVDADGTATLPVLAPRLKVADIKGRSMMIHAGGDNYSDTPPMGGGGARIACGVIK